MMNRRQRTLAALDHKEPDRVPLDFGGRHTTLHLFAHEALMRHLGLTGPKPSIRSYHTYLVEPDPQLLRRFERVSVSFFPKAPSGYVLRIDPTTNTFVDEWGTTYYMPPNGYYYDIHAVPLPEAETAADLARYRWPNPTDSGRIAGLPEQIRATYVAGENVIIMCGAMPGLWEHSWYMFGVEKAFMNLAGSEPLMEALTERILEWQIAYWDMVLSQVGACVDLVQLNEDLGSQHGLMMSPATFRRLYKPRLRRLIASIKQKTAARIYLHSCGSIYRLIPDLIEIGVQVLNPVQVNAVEMDSVRLKREFGKDLTFWGGGCDPVIMGTGTVQQVRDEVKRRIHDLAPGGGFVFGSVHNIQANVPPENIVAMFDAARDLGSYPITSQRSAR
ncbi:MAG TPA: uroporphyrinogen decarboxylase family protein [Candidatus Methylomirabilis sp.]|nr:uroporphyrinogen decarboxylase family protein [Candidatus Methylomirabilis sp.]